VYFLGTVYCKKGDVFTSTMFMLNGHKYSILYMFYISTDYDYRLITIISDAMYTSESGNNLKNNIFVTDLRFVIF
jgi:hypothetical protein